MYDWTLPLTEEDACERMVRCSHNTICELCGLPYLKDPYEGRILDWEGRPFLHQLCDGRLGKL